MKKEWLMLLILGLTLAGCSASSKSEDADVAAADDEVAQDAGTDAVPQESAEQITAPPVDNALAETPAPPPESPAVEHEDYMVQQGDTLMKIAFEKYGDLYLWRKIYDSNRDHITDMNRLTPGTVLKLEKSIMTSSSSTKEGEKYLIQHGDTLGTISNDVYGTSKKWRKIWNNNRDLIKDPNKIYAGFYLYYIFTEKDRIEKEKYQNQSPILSESKPPEETAPSTAQPEAVSNHPTQQPQDHLGLLPPPEKVEVQDSVRAPSSKSAR